MFAKNGVTAFEIMPIFWKAVCYLEKINLKVNAVTADGASPNRNFFKMHKLLDVMQELMLYTEQKISKYKRIDFFFPDTPHLIKTLRNYLFNSGSGRCTRYIWNSGFFLLWSHISRL